MDSAGPFWCVVCVETSANFTGQTKEEFTATYVASNAATVFFDLEDGTRKVFNLQKVLWYTVKPTKREVTQ